MKGIESVCFQIISYTGAAKSCFVEAINEAEQGNFERAEELLCEGSNDGSGNNSYSCRKVYPNPQRIKKGW